MFVISQCFFIVHTKKIVKNITNFSIGDIVQLNKAIVTLENQIDGIEKENNALEADLETEMYDLEYVYDIAVGVLGMVYPNNNEVIYYNNESEGYFRQYQDIPE